MGRVELYSERLLSEYTSQKRLRRRIQTVCDFGKGSVILVEDWVTWVYILIELVFKKLAVHCQVSMNSRAHNLSALLHLFLDSKNPKSKPYVKFKTFIENKMSIYDLFNCRGMKQLLRVPFSSLRYEIKELEVIREYDFKFFVKFLWASFEYLDMVVDENH